MIDFTPEILSEAKKVAANIKLGPLFTPPIARGEGGKIGTAYIANGANWPGGSYDPETGILYVFSNSLTRLLVLANDPKRSDMDFINTGGGGDTGGGGAFPGCNLMPCAITVQGLPFVKPPWGRITAIDLNKGEMVWQIPHGETLDAVTNHPMLKGVKIPRTGRIGPIGTLTTKTLVISGERGFTTLAVRPALREVIRVRQGDGTRAGQSDHARAANRQPDELHAQRQAVPRARHQRARLSCGADCVYGCSVNSRLSASMLRQHHARRGVYTR